MTRRTCPHCGIHIDEHEATRCLDKWIANDVLGVYDKICQEETRFMLPESVNLPYYSTSIAAAWEVVEKLWISGDGPYWVGDFFLEWWQDGEWLVCNKPIGVRDGAIKAMCDGKKTGKPSAPLAICRAAIKAMYND
jgi:hypothetical protein